MPKVTCRKCSIKFNDLSSFRKHQWATHPEIFNNLRKAATRPGTKRKAAAARKANKKAKLALIKASSNGVSTPSGLTALELLNKLKDQQRFIQDVVNLVSGILTQHGSHTK